MNKFLGFALIYLIVFKGFSQNTTASDSIEVQAGIATKVYLASDTLPFWMVANTQGGVGESTQAYLSAFSEVSYSLSENVELSTGFSAFYRDGVASQLQRNELFVQLKTPFLRIIAGSKNSEILDAGLSVTNENIIRSGNSRAFPGVLIEAPSFIKIFKNISIDYDLGHYVLNDKERFVDDTNVHYKRLYVKYKKNNFHSFTAGIQHYAQWGGDSPSSGDLPSGLSDFVKIFFASAGDENSDPGEQANALGNHLGSIDFKYEYTTTKGDFNFYHLHLFEDGSGTRFANFPDGVWGLKYHFKNDKKIKLNYEYINTQNQSGSSGRSGRDNYFGNSIYASGWTYEGRIIGLPFFESNGEVGSGIINNRVVAHHFGARLIPFNKVSLTGKITYLVRKGNFVSPITPNEKSILTYGLLEYTSKWGDLSASMGIDIVNTKTNNWGLALGYSYNLDHLLK